MNHLAPVEFLYNIFALRQLAILVDGHQKKFSLGIENGDIHRSTSPFIIAQGKR
jgi:hypothetical protein